MLNRGLGAAFSPQADSGGRGRESDSQGPAGDSGFLLLDQEWEDLNDVAMSFHGVMRLIGEHGFDNSTGAEELLQLVYREYEKVLSRIRRRREGDENR